MEAVKFGAMDVSESERPVRPLFDISDPGPEDGEAQAYIAERGAQTPVQGDPRRYGGSGLLLRAMLP